MNTKKRNLLKDKRGVSPAIASLVLIVIAVVAAAGVGVITNTLNLQTGEQAEGQDLSVAGKIDMQGSTTVLPFALAAAGSYMEDHPAVEITVSGGGSGHGISMAKVDKVDIGMASKKAPDEDVIQGGIKGATIYETEIGKRMVAVIANDGSNTGTWNVINGTTDMDNQTIGYADLKDLYSGNASAISGYTAYQRMDSSGTEECFAKWLGIETGTDKQLPEGATKVEGNAGVWTAVTGNDKSIGFVDLGYVEDTKYGASQNGTAPSADKYGDYESASDNVNGAETSKLTSKLNYYTHGVPSGATKAFIDFCLSTASDEGQDILEDVGMIPLAA